jgi:ketosteroid isomerase-like protein
VDRDAFRESITQRELQAESALVRGDLEPRLEMWSHADPVSVFGAVGMSRSGWDQLEPAFRSVASRLDGGHDVTYQLLAYDVTGDMAWSAGFVRYVGSIDGSAPAPIGLRITQVYRREHGEWKVAHEHSDFLPPDET